MTYVVWREKRSVSRRVTDVPNHAAVPQEPRCCLAGRSDGCSGADAPAAEQPVASKSGPSGCPELTGSQQRLAAGGRADRATGPPEWDAHPIGIYRQISACEMLRPSFTAIV